MTDPLSNEEMAALEVTLSTCADAARTIRYADLANALNLTPPHRIHRLTLALETLIRRNHAASQPLLAALAVGKSGLPGRGFFQLLAELGRYSGPNSGPIAATKHAAECQEAVAYWSNRSGQ
ncbi:MAG: hypothetical protein GDA41_12060 [Rhodospirillales bacterium]|nr:hypothetical protein [Rhodospirillales bacterium]